MPSQQKKRGEFIFNFAENTYNTLKKFIANLTRKFSNFQSKKQIKTSQTYGSNSTISSNKDNATSKTKLIKKNKQKKFTKKFGAFLYARSQQQTLKNFQCPICLEILIKATPTPCGHLFCRQCLDHTVVISPSCPICRTDLTDIQFVNYTQMDQLIQQALTKLSNNSLKKSYQIRYREYMQYQNQKKIKIECLNKGAMVDILDNRNIWRQGKIKQMHHQSNGQLFLRVGYTTNEVVNEQIINSNSQRLASYKFYTKDNLLMRNQSYYTDGRNQHDQFTIQQFQNINEDYTQISQQISQNIQFISSFNSNNIGSIVQLVEEQKSQQLSELDINQVFNFSDFADLQGQNSMNRQS